MSPWDGFIYNFLAIGVIFPWIYAYGPALAPGVDFCDAVLLALLAQVPVALAYAFLATTLPISGGDYLFQSRAFGHLGFVIVMSGYVIWILAWIPLSGWLFIKAGLAPFLFTLGESGANRFAMMLQSDKGMFIGTVLLAFAAILLVRRSLRTFVVLPRILFVLTAAALCVICAVYRAHQGNFVQDLESSINTFLPALIRDGVLPSSGAYSVPIEAVRSGGSAAGWVGVLAAAPLAWSSLQWSIYSVQHNSEIRGADRFWNQFLMLVVSAVVAAGALYYVGRAQAAAMPGGVLARASMASMLEPRPADTFTCVTQTILPPYPHTFALAVSRSVWVRLLITAGILANAFQITCNCFIGMSRILVAMSVDTMLPVRFYSAERDGEPSFQRAYATYFIFGVLMSAGYYFVHLWSDVALVIVTVLGSYVLTLTALAATKIPHKRLANFWMSSSLHRIPARVFTCCGIAGASAAAMMILGYVLLVPEEIRYIVLVVASAAVVIAIVLFVYARSRGAIVREGLSAIPLEAHQLKYKSKDPVE